MRALRVVGCLVLLGCGSTQFVTLDGGADSDTDGNVSVIEGGSVPDAPANCDIQKLPTQDPCVIHESAGVFVSSSLGGAQGDGSRAKPFATIQAGIDAAKATQRRVYVCAESYVDPIVFAEGVSVFGYFDCKASWTVAAKHASIATSTSPAARASNVTARTLVQALDVAAPDVSGPSASSIALVALGAPGLVLDDVKLHGGKGGAGADGANAVQLTDSGSKATGTDASGNYSCNPNVQFTCAIGPTTSTATNACAGKPNIAGGPGGTNGPGGYYVSEFNSLVWVWNSKATPGPGGAQPANATTAKGGIDGVSTPDPGADGASGTNGAPGVEVGTFKPTGDYLASAGGPGTDGKPGQGGGAGAGHMANPPTPPSNYQNYYFWGARGGGGGAGGCPGLAAEPGGGGGASVALLAINSPMEVRSSTLDSSTGGKGGAAGAPSQYTLGGSGGLTNQGAQGGAPGGRGGLPGVSGNGAGGPSIAVVSTGGAPMLMGCTLSPGSGGAGVAMRTVNAFTIPASPAGRSAPTHTF